LRKSQHSPIDIAYFFSHEDYDDKDRRVIKRRHPRDDLREFKIEAVDLMETSIQKTT